MSRFVAAFALLVGLVAALVAILPAGGVAVAGELRRERVGSPNLGRDLPFLIYLPDGYAASQKRYPVLYLLHGADGDETAWSVLGQIKETADRLIANGDIPPCLIVMPGCLNCWWVDGAKDKAETAFWKDLVPAVDRNFRTLDKRTGRVVAGNSAGGFGALRFALTHPEKIAAVAALSPAIYADAPPATSAARRSRQFLKADGSFDTTAWTARNYPAVIERYFAQKERVGVYLSSGDGDKLGIAFEAALLHKHLAARQPELVELRVADGEHSWALWRTAIVEGMRYALSFTEPGGAASNARSLASVADTKSR